MIAGPISCRIDTLESLPQAIEKTSGWSGEVFITFGGPQGRSDRPGGLSHCRAHLSCKKGEKKRCGGRGLGLRVFAAPPAMQLSRFPPTQSPVRRHPGTMGRSRRSPQPAIALNPSDSSYHYVLGEVYRRLGKTKDAQEQMEIFRKLEKDSTDFEQKRRESRRESPGPKQDLPRRSRLGAPFRRTQLFDRLLHD